MPESAAKKRWDKQNTRSYTIKLNRNTDGDIMDKLDKTPNRQGYIKRLIRADIDREMQEG